MWLSITQGRKTRIPDAENPQYAPVDATRAGIDQRNHLPTGGVRWLGNTGRTHSDKERVSTKVTFRESNPRRYPKLSTMFTN
jgi:hypothetical protein